MLFFGAVYLLAMVGLAMRGRFQTVPTDDYHFAPEKRLDDQRRRDGDDEHGNAVYQDEQEKEVALYVG